MAYRGDRTSLALRCEELEREMQELAEVSKSLEPSLARWLQAKQRTEEVRHELTLAHMQLEALGPRSLRLLENVRVASPCSANWEEMAGDERIRFCKGCSKNVYNLSAMTQAEAQALVQRSEALCVRFYGREDGTILAGDCTVGARKKRRRRAALAVSGGLMAAGALASAGLSVRRHAATMSTEESASLPPATATANAPTTPAPQRPFDSPATPRAFMGERVFHGPAVGPNPTTAIGPAVVNGGGLTSEQVRRVVMAHTGALRACYESEAQKQPELRGGVNVSFTVEADGSVSQSAIASSTLGSPRAEGCMLRQVKAWRFPTSGAATTVAAFPFRFGASP